MAQFWRPPPLELGTASFRVRVALADADASSIELPSAGATGAALVWDAPTFVRRRGLSELARLTRGALAQYGWRGLPRRLLLAPSRDDGHAYLAWVEQHHPDVATLATWRDEARAGPTHPLSAS